jgi:N-acyl-D-aspartate/D-glutamate deacylase
MKHSVATIALVALLTIFAACAAADRNRGAYDLVVRGGQVMDPESGLAAVRDVGIRAGRIEAISENPLQGARIIDAAGLVVAPGFIDLHEHGQSEEAYALMVRDGVTSAFELEVGTRDVAAWYAERESGELVNHGVSIGHIPVRMAVFGDPGGLLPAGIGGSGAATEAQLADMAARIEAGLDEGAVAVGFGSAYTPAATMEELDMMFRVAAERGASVHIHMRGGLAGLDSTIALAAATGAKLHIVHVNSSGAADTEPFLTRIQAARVAGQDVTTEAYPYGAGMTAIESALFDDWQTWGDDEFGRFQWVATGERLTRASFARHRAGGGTVIIHDRTEEMTRAAIASPLSMIASDGFIENGRGHPRTSGTYAKVLGRYVREDRVVDLMDALRRMSLEPARRLEARVPAMASKGRVRIGADADLVVFDPATVRDRSTYEDATIPSEGIPYVIVNGSVVVDGGQLVPGARPGRGIRAEVRVN